MEKCLVSEPTIGKFEMNELERHGIDENENGQLWKLGSAGHRSFHGLT